MPSLIRIAGLVAGLAVIFLLSVLPRAQLPETGVSDKLEHFAAYGVLAVLAWFAVPNHDDGARRRQAMIGLVLYGIALECVQFFIPGRFFSLWDILANCGGVLAAYIGMWMVTHRFRGEAPDRR